MNDEERKAWEEYVVWVRMADMDMMGYEGFKKDRPAILAMDAEWKRLRENNDSLMGRICELMHREEELEATFAHHHAALYDGEKLSDFCRYCGLDIRDDVHSELMRNAKAELRKAKEGTSAP